MRIFQCQKKTCFVCLLLLFCSLFLSFAFLSSPTHALSISSTNYGSFTNQSASNYSLDGGSTVLGYFTNAENNIRYFSTNYNSSIDFTRFVLYPASPIPKGSVLNFKLTWTFSGSNTFQRPYLLNSNFINTSSYSATIVQVLNYNCSDEESHYGNSNRYTLSCDITVYYNSDYQGFPLDVNLHAGNDGSTSAVLVLISVSRFNYFVLNYDSLSANDKDWLSDDFLEAMTDAIAEGQKQANEDVKDQTETQTQQSESTSNTEGSSSETQGQTLLQAFSSFVSAITNVQPAQNCDLDVDFTGYAPGLQTTIDLCELSPPAGLTFIGSILLILFCV